MGGGYNIISGCPRNIRDFRGGGGSKSVMTTHIEEGLVDKVAVKKVL